MQSYTRVTKLNNIQGRAGYITNPGKQEEIVIESAPVDWQPYVDYELNNQKSKEKNNQGREIIFSIPNEWYELPREELRERVQPLVELAVGKSTDLQWAVHWNKARTNFHVHVVFSERSIEKNPGRWDRDIYLTEDGKIARKKADRAKDSSGKDLPPVHRKGDLKGGYTAKNTMYLQRTFNKQVRTLLEKEMSRRYGVIFEEPKPLKQFHHGKGSESGAIKKKNEIIKETNYLLSIFKEIGYDKLYNSALAVIKKQFKNKIISVMYYDTEYKQLRSNWYKNIDNAYAFFNQTKEKTREMAERTKTHVLSQRTAEQHQTPAAPEPVKTPVEPEIDRAAIKAAIIDVEQHTAPEPEKKPIEPEIDRAAIRAAIVDVDNAKLTVNAAKMKIWWVDEPQINYSVINLPEKIRSSVNKLSEISKKQTTLQQQLAEFPRPTPPNQSFFNFKKKKEQAQYEREMAAWREQTADVREKLSYTNAEVSVQFEHIKQYLEPYMLIKGYRGGGYTLGQLENNQIKANNITAADVTQLELWAKYQIKDKYQPAADKEQKFADKVQAWENAKSDLAAAQEHLKNLTKDVPEETVKEVELEYRAEIAESKKTQQQQKEKTMPVKTKSSERER